MIASNASWIKKSGPSQESFCILALLSMLIAAWDIAGAFTMMGCAAAIFSEPDQVALFFEQPVEQHPDTPL